MTKRIAVLVAAAGFPVLFAGTANAAPDFSAMQLNLLCPAFDGPMGPGGDQVLLDTAKRVYQGKSILGIQGREEASACKRFVRNGKGGWFLARVTWSSAKNPSLYVENTAAWAGSQGDEAHELVLFLDGNGNAGDFNKMYVDPKTNILNEPGLTISVEVEIKGKCERDKCERHRLDHHKDKGKCGHDGRAYCEHQRGDRRCGHDGDDDDGLCIHERKDGDCVHKRNDGRCEHGRGFGRDNEDDGKCHHDRDDGSHCVHEKGDGRCGCDKGEKKNGGGECPPEWILINQQRIKPTPWALWSLHSADSADLYNQIQKIDGKISNIVIAANKYTDEQITDLHNHVHQEIAAETILRQQGDAQTLMSANNFTNVQIKNETDARMLSEQNLTNQINAKVNSVSGAFPITSSGGTDPVIGLAKCPEGEVYISVEGKWKCGQMAVAVGTAVYNRNVAQCGPADLLTPQQGCTFALPNCLRQADLPHACPAAPAQCSFSQTDTSQVCLKQEFVCEFFGCFPVCVQFETTFCGNCDCVFPKVGALLK